jgi:hypothetical protein
MILEDGTGQGYQAQVDDENRLHALATTQSTAHDANHNGKAYTLLVSVTPAAAGDCFCWLQNLDDEDLILSGFWLWLAASEYIYIDLATTGTPGGSPTAITPANLNVGSGNVADGTFYQDPDITGLTSGRVGYRIYHLTLAGSTHYDLPQDIVVQKNQVVSFWVETGGTALHMTLEMHYHVD